MNKRAFWKFRKIILKILFYIKKSLYRIIDSVNGKNEYKPFVRSVIKSSVWGILKTSMLIIIVLLMDESVFKIGDAPKVDDSLFIPFVIGGISVAGIILGLYCANIASIYSLRYANAPRDIVKAFQNDRLTLRCVYGIVDYIIFGFLVIFVTILELRIGWIMVTVYSLWSIAVIVSYSIAGNRAYQLSDVYSVAADPNRILYRVITKRLNQKLFSTDSDFQNHFMKVADKQIRQLKSIQEYGERINKGDNIDNSTMIEFMISNLLLIQLYWTIKKNICKSSLWFRNKPKYPKWHLSSSTDVSIALRTGTSMRTIEERNYWWFEEELVSINKNCLNCLLDQYDYTSIYKYIWALRELCSTAIKCKEANIYVAHIDWIKQEIEERIVSDEIDDNGRDTFAGVIDTVSLLYLDLILESSKAYQDFDLESIVLKVIKAIDSGEYAEKNEYIRGRQDIEFYKQIITEVKVEGKRITPSWVIKQQIAKEEYVYLNSLLDIVREGMEHAFSLGKTLSEKELHFEACIIITRFYEYESKLTRFINIVKSRTNELTNCQIDKELKWDEFRLGKLQNAISEWKKDVPKLLVNCSSRFALDNWKNREEYPDFLGDCYNHICEDAVESIISGDITQFEIDFENLSKLMLLYQEYIRTDCIKNKDYYRVEYAYYMFTSPIIEWAQIGGLAILWGEFFSDAEWKKCVCDSSDLIFKKDGEPTGLAEKLIEYIQDRHKFFLGIGDRDIIETGWKLGVANAIRNSGICESEYDDYRCRLKSDSKLLNAFCPAFMDMGFTTDPSEVFWVVCVNPIVSEDKRFHTRFSWEEKLDD